MCRWLVICCLLFHVSLVGFTPEEFSERIQVWFAKLNEEPKSLKEGVWYANYLAEAYQKEGRTMPESYWQGHLAADAFVCTKPFHFELKRGAKATQALKSAIEGVSVIDCGNATQLIYFLALSDLLGEEAFDELVTSHQEPLCISTYDASSSEHLFHVLFAHTKIASPSLLNQRPLELGQLAYFRNYPLYLTKHPMGVAQGYNTIYVGKNVEGEQLFCGFWRAGPKTEEEILELLVQRYLQPQDRFDEIYFKEHPKEKALYQKDLERFEAKMILHHTPFFEDDDVQSYRLKN